MLAKRTIFGRPVGLALVALYKGLLGLIEVLGGTVLLAISYGASSLLSSGMVQALVNHELAEDPNDVFLHWLLTHNLPLAHRTMLALGWLALGLGLVKILIAIGIWFRSRRLRTISILILAALGVLGLVTLVNNWSLFKLITVMLDLVVLYYLWRVLPRYLVQQSGK